MSRRRKLGFLTVLAVVLVCSAILLGSDSSQATAGTESQVADRVGEMQDLRTRTSKTFELADGTREWVGYAGPVHYRDASGSHQEIDNSIVGDNAVVDGIDYSLRNGANEYTARFATRSDGDHLVNIEMDGKSLSFGLAHPQTTEVETGPAVGSKSLSDLTYGQALVEYPDIYPGLDLYYKTVGYGVKEYLVLRGPGAQDTYVFNLALKGLTAREVDGRIHFLDSQQNSVFQVAEPFAVDEAGDVTKDIGLVLSQDADDRCQLTMTVSSTYLINPKRAFPVVIDPTIVITSDANLIFDTFIANDLDYDDTNFGTSPSLRTGKDTTYGARRTLLRFDLSPLAQAHIGWFWPYNAWIRIERNTSVGGQNPTIHAYYNEGSWGSGTVTWNTRPDYTTSYGSNYAWNDSGNWWRMDGSGVTTVVKRWLLGVPDYEGLLQRGWTIKDINEGDTAHWTTFYSCNAGSPHMPELHVTYSVWTYAYDGHTTGSWRTWQPSQSATNSAKDVAGDSYYRLKSNLTSDWRLATIAAADTWNNAPSSFLFYQLPYEGNDNDHSIGYVAEANGNLATNYGSSVWDGQAKVTTWRIVFNANYANQFFWGQQAGKYDMQYLALHELGHSLKLLDLYCYGGTSYWSDASILKPTMAGFGTNTLAGRSLAEGDNMGIQGLY